MTKLKHLTEGQITAVLLITDARARSKRFRERETEDGGENIPILQAEENAGKALFAVLMLMPFEALQELAGLMWLGRNDHDDFEEASRQFQFEHGRENAVRYLVGKSPLGKYIRLGLEKLGHSVL